MKAITSLLHLFLLLFVITSSHEAPNHQCHREDGWKSGRSRPYGKAPNPLEDESTRTTAITPTKTTITSSTTESTTTPSTTTESTTTPPTTTESTTTPSTTTYSPMCPGPSPGIFDPLPPSVVPDLLCYGPKSTLHDFEIFAVRINYIATKYKKKDLGVIIPGRTIAVVKHCPDQTMHALICYNVDAKRVVVIQHNVCFRGYQDGDLFLLEESYDNLVPGKDNLIVCVLHKQNKWMDRTNYDPSLTNFDWYQMISSHDLDPEGIQGIYFYIDPRP